MKFFVLISLTLLSSIAWSDDDSQAAKQQHYSSLFARQNALHGSYRDTYLALTDINKKEALQTWYRAFLKDGKQALEFDRAMKNIEYWMFGQDYRRLLYYFTVTGQVQQAGQTLGLYVLSSHALLDNFANDPQSEAFDEYAVRTVKDKLPPLQLSKIDDVRECYTQLLTSENVVRGFSVEYSSLVRRGLERCARDDRYVMTLNRLLQMLFKYRDYPGAPFPISFSGYVGGNQVDLHDRIPMAPQDILLLGEQLSLIQKAIAPGMGKPYSQLSVEEYKSMMATPEAAINDLFTDAEGFRNIHDIENFNEMGYITDTRFYGHPSFQNINGQRGIFAQMIQSIRDAEDSVFIDLFWMGGTIGMNLAKELMKKTVENPNFTVIIITDNENKFQYGVQLDMIFRYMQAYSEKFASAGPQPLNFYMVPANVGLKRTALPEFVDLLITNDVVNNIKGSETLQSQLEKDGFHLLAKSDHTKAMVVDGKNPEKGVAYVGSKNWTDGSGGANYDQMAEVKGPAAALILDAFYYDALEAFELEAQDNQHGQVVYTHWQAKYPELSKRKAIEHLLAPIDVLDRYKGQHYDVPYVALGDEVVAPTQNNIYGTEMSPIEQNIQAILTARHQVLIDDQFLYDPKVVEALLAAKQQHGVEVYVILESLTPYEPDASKVGAHLPNSLFIPELVANGIEVKWQKPPQSLVDAILEDSAAHPGQQISATFHVKSLSVDGVLKGDSHLCRTGEEKSPDDSAPVLITGSANKDVMTMSGGFRESQVAVYSEKAVTQHDCLFWARWEDPNSTESTDGLDFDLPPQAADMGITDKTVFLNTLRQVLFSTYNFTKDFF